MADVLSFKDGPLAEARKIAGDNNQTPKNNPYLCFLAAGEDFVRNHVGQSADQVFAHAEPKAQETPIIKAPAPQPKNTLEDAVAEIQENETLSAQQKLGAFLKACRLAHCVAVFGNKIYFEAPAKVKTNKITHTKLSDIFSERGVCSGVSGNLSKIENGDMLIRQDLLEELLDLYPISEQMKQYAMDLHAAAAATPSPAAEEVEASAAEKEPAPTKSRRR